MLNRLVLGKLRRFVMKHVLLRQVNSLAKLRGYFFCWARWVSVHWAGASYWGTRNRCPPNAHPPRLRTAQRTSKKHPLANQTNGYPQENASLRHCHARAIMAKMANHFGSSLCASPPQKPKIDSAAFLLKPSESQFSWKNRVSSIPSFCLQNNIKR